MNKNIFILITIIIAAIAPYVNSIHNPFIWDEEEIVVNNPIIKDGKHLPDVFKTNIFGTGFGASGYYRPLYTLSFMFDYNIWGLNTFGYHLFNIIFHAINAVLLYLIISRIGLSGNIAWLGGILFAVYPVNCEAVTLIAARVELIAAFLLSICFVCFLNGIKGKWGNFILSWLFFAMAILTKESVMVFPFIILFYALIFLDGDGRRKTTLPLMVLMAIAFSYGIFRFLLLKGSAVSTLSLINSASFIERALTLPRILFTYIALTLFPVKLISEYNFVSRSFMDPYFLSGVFTLIAFFSVIYFFIRPKKQAVFFTAWFLIALIPYFNIIVPLHATLMEHWAYFASMGFAALTSMAVFNLREARFFKKQAWFVAIAAIVCIIGFYVVRITERNKEWGDPFLLYKSDSQKDPNSFLLHCNLGVEYFRRGMMKEAEKEFEASNKVSPVGAYDAACNNLGVIYARKGDIQRAIAMYRKSIEINNYHLAYANLGELYNNLNMHEDAKLVLEEGAKLYPLNQAILRQLKLSEQSLKR